MTGAAPKDAGVHRGRKGENHYGHSKSIGVWRAINHEDPTSFNAVSTRHGTLEMRYHVQKEEYSHPS